MGFNYKVIVFDKDGTLGHDLGTLMRWKDSMLVAILAQVERQGRSTRAVACKFYEAIGWDVDTGKLLPSAAIAVGTWDETLNLCAIALRDHLPDAIEYMNRWQKELGNLHAEDEPVVDNLKCMLQQCKNDYGLTAAVCTSDVRVSTVEAISRWGINECIEHIVTADDVIHPKPSPHPLLKVCALASVIPSECIMVGDTTHDISMGVAAGAGVIIGVLSGSGTESQLKSHGAHHVIQDVSLIPLLLKQISSNT